MLFTSILSLLAVASTAALAAPQRGDDPGQRLRPKPPPIQSPPMQPPPPTQPGSSGPQEIELLRLVNIKGVTMGASSFTGRGIPGVCYNLPFEVDSFEHADAAPGFECEIFFETACRGSGLSVANPLPEARLIPGAPVDERPVISSWKCEYMASKSPFPDYD